MLKLNPTSFVLLSNNELYELMNADTSKLAKISGFSEGDVERFKGAFMREIEGRVRHTMAAEEAVKYVDKSNN